MFEDFGAEQVENIARRRSGVRPTIHVLGA
jgi:hypothetical protein